MKRYLYHVTEQENVFQIIQEGLKRKNGFAVYLSEQWDSWWKPGMAILRVRTKGMNKEFQMYKLDENLDEIIVFGDIDPERISIWNPSDEEFRKAEERYRRLLIFHEW